MLFYEKQPVPDKTELMNQTEQEYEIKILEMSSE